MEIRFDSLDQLYENITNEEAAHKYIAQIRWRHGMYCPKCGSTGKVYAFSDGKRYKCTDCRDQFTVRIGTIFQNSPVPLRKWIVAIWLMSSNRRGIPATQLQRELGVAYNTALFMKHRIRKAFGATDNAPRLSGTIEVDESYIGGREANKHKHKRTGGTKGRSIKTKKPVLAMLQRGGDIVARPVENTKKRTIAREVLKSVASGSVISTDEFLSYRHLGRLYHHVMVNHRVGQYVKGMAHTNGVESFWSLLKRGYIGIYYKMSAKHLHRYVDEYSARFNMRKERSSGIRCENIISRITCGKLSWRELTG